MYRDRFACVLAIVMVATFVLPSSLTAQITFQRTYGGALLDIGSSLCQTTDGGYVIAGSTGSRGAGRDDVWLIRTNARGDTVWTRTFGGTSYDYGESVQQTSDSGYIIAGSTESFGAGNGDVYLIKTDAVGDTQWTRTFGGAGTDDGRSVQQTFDGGYIVAGYTGSFGAGSDDVYVIKSDADGDTMWTRTFGGTGRDWGYSVEQTADGGYVVVGVSFSVSPTMSVLYLIKLDSLGDTLWNRAYGGASDVQGFSIEQTSDSGYIAAGYIGSYPDNDMYLVKIAYNGDTLWTRTFGDTSTDEAWSVQHTTDGGYVIAGTTGVYPDDNLYLVRTDAAGDTEWTRTFGGTKNDGARAVRQAADGGYAVAGITWSSGAGQCDVYFIKTDSFGYVSSVEEPKTDLIRPISLTLTCEPNPCRGATMVNFQPRAVSSNSVTLRVYDAQGRLVHSESRIPASSFRLDLQSMPAGTYFCRLGAGDDLATAVLLKL